jgi:hypothetical protein
MAATVQIVEKNGAGGTTTDKTSGTIRFKNADNSTADTDLCRSCARLWPHDQALLFEHPTTQETP